MEKEAIEFFMSIHRLCAIEEYGEKAIVVINEGEAGEYENNPTIIEYEAKGYHFVDANMFGHDTEILESLTFIPIE
ncbi:MAG: hypothetical protein IKZ14_05015 [Muribaculaceae bacterium]|nr:hypothetical protein [Muribaculaceae bacterium]